MKLNYKYFTLKEVYEGRYNISERKETIMPNGEKIYLHLGSFEKIGRQFVFVPEQPDDREIYWFKACLEDVIIVLTELNKK